MAQSDAGGYAPLPTAISSEQPALGYSSGSVLRQGSSGTAVTSLQQRLAALGYYRGSIDGVFGQETEAAVLQLQRDRGLRVDGIVGSQVYQALGIESSAPEESQSSGRQLALGDSGADVERLQQRLENLGYFNSSATGYYGSITQEAVAQFQQDNRLAITGSADARTLNALGITTAVGSDAGDRYVVVVPQRDSITLARVRQVVPSAFLAPSRLGAFVQVGAFPSLEAADRQTQLLRSRGLDARVTYQ